MEKISEFLAVLPGIDELIPLLYSAGIQDTCIRLNVEGIMVEIYLKTAMGDLFKSIGLLDEWVILLF